MSYKNQPSLSLSSSSSIYFLILSVYVRVYIHAVQVHDNSASTATSFVYILCSLCSIESEITILSMVCVAYVVDEIPVPTLYIAVSIHT